MAGSFSWGRSKPPKMNHPSEFRAATRPQRPGRARSLRRPPRAGVAAGGWVLGASVPWFGPTVVALGDAASQIRKANVTRSGSRDRFACLVRRGRGCSSRRQISSRADDVSALPHECTGGARSAPGPETVSEASECTPAPSTHPPPAPVKRPGPGGSATNTSVRPCSTPTALQSADGVAADAEGNVVIVGSFEGHVDFGGGSLVSGGALDVYVAKLSP